MARDEDPELGLFLRLAVVLGTRRGELYGLKWRDVDLDNGEVFIVLPKTERLIRLISRWTSKSRTIGRSGGLSRARQAGDVEDHRVSYGWSSVCLGVGDGAVLSLASGSLPDS